MAMDPLPKTGSVTRLSQEQEQDDLESSRQNRPSPICATATSGSDAWTWWRQVMHSPRYLLAPMVEGSELAFRMLCRHEYGAHACYTPMLHAGMMPILHAGMLHSSSYCSSTWDYRLQ